MKSLHNMDVHSKRVLLRTSLNVPITAEGGVGDLFRLKRALPTLEYLIEQKAKIILVGYLGREGATLAPVAHALQELVPHTTITFSTTPLADIAKEVEALEHGCCLMIENIRREPGEEKNDAVLAKELAALADVFIDDAFAEAHRAYASNVGVASLLPSCAGFLFEEEVRRLCEALKPPQGALAIIGGAKFETKEPLLQKLLELYETVLVGGALADDILKSRGTPIAHSLVSDVPVPAAISESTKILVPIDAQVEDENTHEKRVILTNSILAHEAIIDIGPRTQENWSAHIKNAAFVVWNGPMGIYEQGSTTGTDAIAQALVDAGIPAVIGGGDTAAALAKFTFDPEKIFVSTGGGAMLEFLTHGTLPAIDVLQQ